MKELNVSLLKRNLFGRVVLGCPKPLEYTNSFPYQLCDLLVYNGESPMWFSVQTNPLWDGLNPSSSLVLDVPLVCLDLYLLFYCCFTFFLLSILPFCVLSSSRDFGHFFLSTCVLFSIHSLKPFVPMALQFLFHFPSDRLLQLRLEFHV